MKNEIFNKRLFNFFLLATLPTIIMGIMKKSTYTNTLVWIWDALMIILLFGYCLMKKYKIPKNKLPFVIYFMLVFLSQIIAYSFSLKDNLINPLYMILPLLYFVHFFCSFILIGGQKDRYNFNLFFKYFLIFVLFACVYNIAINYSNFSNIFKFNNKYLGFSSFFNHRNGFGQLLFFGIVTNTIILSRENEKKYWLSMAFILLNLILTFSRTSILATIVFGFFYYMQNLLTSNSKSKVFKAFILTVLICICVIMILMNKNIMNFLNYYVFRSEDGLSGRDTVWSIAFSKLTGIRIFIGYGIGSSSTLLETVNLTNSHNTFIEILLTGGIVLFSLYIIIFGVILKKILNFKDKNLKKIYTSFYSAFMVYMMFEKVLLYSTGYAPIMFTIFLSLIPCLVERKENEG